MLCGDKAGKFERVHGYSGEQQSGDDVQGNNLTVAHVSMEQPVPGVPLTVSVDLLESKFVHERRGSRVSREQFMMVLSNIRVLHIRASYFSIASMVLYVIVFSLNYLHL